MTRKTKETPVPEPESGALRELIEKTNVCVVDLDECIYPGFTQTTLAALLLLQSLCRLRFHNVFSLIRGAFSLALIRLRRGGRNPDGNRRLMLAFSRAIRGMELKTVERKAALLPGRGLQDWRPALEKIAETMEVVLVTFAIEPLARAYGEARGPSGKKIFRSWSGTPLEVRNGAIAGVRLSSSALSPRSKVEAIEENLRGRKELRPLVVGHGRDESALADWARERGGGAVGLSAAGGDLESFDIKLPGRGWPAITRALVYRL